MNYQRSILGIHVIKGIDRAMVFNEKTVKRAQCPGAKARSLFGKDLVKASVPFSCLFGETEFKISGHAYAERDSWSRGSIVDSTSWTQMLNIAQPIA